MGEAEDSQEPVEISLEDLDSPERLLQLGMIVRESLARFGTATFVLDEDEKVNHVNPTHVYISQEVVTPPRGKVARPVRPIVSSGRPQFIQIMEDGSAWEVDFENCDEVQIEDATGDRPC